MGFNLTYKGKTSIFLYFLIFVLLIAVTAVSVAGIFEINSSFSSFADSLIPSILLISDISNDYSKARTELYRYLDDYEESPYLIMESFDNAAEKLAEIEKLDLPAEFYHLAVSLSMETQKASGMMFLLKYHIDRNNHFYASRLSGTLMLRFSTLQEQAELLKEGLIAHITQSNLESRKAIIKNNTILASAMFFLLMVIIAVISLQNRTLYREVSLRTASLNRQVKKLEETRSALQESEARFEALFNKAPLGYQSLDINGNFIDVNETWLSAMGYARDEVLGQWFGKFVASPYLEKFCSEFEKYKTEGEMHGLELKLLRKGGDYLHASFEGRVVRNSDGSFRQSYSIFNDITKRKELEEKLRQSEKMNALGQLAGGIAHDFNNQLAGIMGYTELIKNVSGDKSVLKYADSVISSCNSAAALIRQLLFFARKGSLSSLPVDMHQVLKKVLSIIRRSIDRKIALSASFEAESAKVMGDESQLQNVFLNLAINARDAMPRGGKLEISTINKIFDGTPAGEKTDIPFPGRYIEISVSDTGEGIPENIRHRIFEPFFTTKDAGRGTGLGLSAVYGTVAGHNGTVSFATEEGKGTVFRVLLPVSSAALPEKKDEEPAPVSVSGRYSILVVDDEELLKELLVSILEKEKHRITAFSGAREALSFFETNWKNIDLVILDMVMPEMDGAELFGKMKELNPSVRAILSSGYSFEHEYESLEGLGIAGFIQKPYSAKVLLEKVREVMSGT